MAVHTGNPDELHGLSLCAGYGGLELGISIAEPGYRTVCFVEREAHAAATLVARMADAALDSAPVWDDLRSFDGRPWRGKVHILTAGYPCQPFSMAGQAPRRSRSAPPLARGCSGSSERFAQWPCLSRTWKGTSIWDLPMSSAGFADWATAQKRACSRREKWALATGVAASSSWPTPTATDAGYMPDVLIGAGDLTIGKPFDKAPTSSGQFSLTNAARAWTKTWAALKGMGWQPPQSQTSQISRSSPLVRVSFQVWHRLLHWRPDLQPAILRTRDGLADRVDRTRGAGNGVCSLAAAIAYRTLKADFTAGWAADWDAEGAGR